MGKDYQRRPDWIADRAWERGYLTSFELVRIGAYKSAKGVASLTVNTEQDIERRTRDAIQHIRPWKGRNVVGLDDSAMWDDWRETARRAIGVKKSGDGLLGLKGVNYPMASMILDILEPAVWPVIDRLAVLTVFGTGPDGRERRRGQWTCAAVYQAYARHLATVGPAHWERDTIHLLDEEAMRAGKSGSLPNLWTYVGVPPCT